VQRLIAQIQSVQQERRVDGSIVVVIYFHEEHKVEVFIETFKVPEQHQEQMQMTQLRRSMERSSYPGLKMEIYVMHCSMVVILSIEINCNMAACLCGATLPMPAHRSAKNGQCDNEKCKNHGVPYNCLYNIWLVLL
jgi:hypothetical protein